MFVINKALFIFSASLTLLLIFLITGCGSSVGSNISSENNLPQSLGPLAIPENQSQVDEARDTITNLGNATQIEAFSLNATTTTTLANLTTATITPSYCMQVPDTKCAPTCSPDNDYDCCRQKGACWSITTFNGCVQDMNCTLDSTTTTTTIPINETTTTLPETTTTLPINETTTTSTSTTIQETTTTTTLPATTTTTTESTTTTTLPATTTTTIPG